MSSSFVAYNKQTGDWCFFISPLFKKGLEPVSYLIPLHNSILTEELEPSQAPLSQV